MIKDNGLINQADTANLLNITKESMNPPFYIILPSCHPTPRYWNFFIPLSLIFQKVHPLFSKGRWNCAKIKVATISTNKKVTKINLVCHLGKEFMGGEYNPPLRTILISDFVLQDTKRVFVSVIKTLDFHIEYVFW